MKFTAYNLVNVTQLVRTEHEISAYEPTQLEACLVWLADDGGPCPLEDFARFRLLVNKNEESIVEFVLSDEGGHPLAVSTLIAPTATSDEMKAALRRLQQFVTRIGRLVNVEASGDLLSIRERPVIVSTAFMAPTAEEFLPLDQLQATIAAAWLSMVCT